MAHRRAAIIERSTGIFSQLPELMFFIVETELPDGNIVHTNKDLGLMKSFHMVAGYDFLILEGIRLKSEIYFQHLFQIPVNENVPAYSMLNSGKGYYFLFTTSLFKSTYKGYDEIERNTAFSNNFVINLLSGKEFRFKGKNLLNFDLKTTWAGGMCYVPFHTFQAEDNYYIRIDEWNKAYQERRPDYFRLNLRIGYKVNFKKVTVEVAVDFLNVTNQKNIYFEFYDPSTGEIKTVYQLPFLPVPLIRVQF